MAYNEPHYKSWVLFIKSTLILFNIIFYIQIYNIFINKSIDL